MFDFSGTSRPSSMSFNFTEPYAWFPSSMIPMILWNPCIDAIFMAVKRLETSWDPCWFWAVPNPGKKWWKWWLVSLTWILMPLESISNLWKTGWSKKIAKITSKWVGKIHLWKPCANPPQHSMPQLLFSQCHFYFYYLLFSHYFAKKIYFWKISKILNFVSFYVFHDFTEALKSFKNSLKIFRIDFFHWKSLFSQCSQRNLFTKIIQVRSRKSFSIFSIISQIHFWNSKKKKKIAKLFSLFKSQKLPRLTGILLAATFNISSLLSRSGIGTCIILSNLPGLNKASSNNSTRFVAPTTITSWEA